MFKCLVDVVSNISFCASTQLSDEENLIDLLFEYITLNPALYQDLSDNDIILFKDGILIPSLRFRTFILQLLLKERYCLNFFVGPMYSVRIKNLKGRYFHGIKILSIMLY